MKLRTALLCVLLAGAGAPGARAAGYARTPGDLDPPATFTRLNIVNPDSSRLAAWIIPAQDSAGTPLGGRHPGLLLVPGETPMDGRAKLAAAMARRGFTVVIFDRRGVGESDPFFPGPGVAMAPQYLRDAHSGLWVLWRRPDVDTTRVAVYGERYGAWLALALAGERPEVRAVVAVSPPGGSPDWIREMERHHPGREYSVAKGWDRRDDPDKVVNRFNGAILFVAGSGDLDFPVWMTEDLHRRYPRPKDLWTVPGAGQGASSPAAVLGSGYYTRVASFLTDYLAKPPHRGWPER